MKFLLFLCALAGLCFAWIGTAHALDSAKAVTQYVHNAWQTDQGLPQNYVQAIVQTRDGYIWLATQEGLVRFDGISFTVFDKRNTPELKANNIQALYEDRAGALSVEYIHGILLDREGMLVIGASTLSANIPLANAFRSSLLAGDRDLNPIVVKLDLRDVSAGGDPTITKATMTAKKLIIEGANFAQGARIVLDGVPQQTTNDAARPTSKLISKKAGKKIKDGKEVMIQVQNPDGKMSDQYHFLRQ